jgi:two-component system NtrC family response regulator
VFDVALPALRDRPEDVLVLAGAFVEELGRSIGRPAAGLSKEVEEKLLAHAWPGNVRELRNAIERAMILCEGGLITSEHLPVGIAAAALAGGSGAPTSTAPGPAHRSPPTPPAGAAAGPLDAAERQMILDALARAGNNKSKAARLLGLTRAQLRSRIEKHGLVVED